ncbi:hypothetical protein IAQ61_006441 [Plenodomus lingam]|uniref:Predicted protein n=1 Tax=Leptosphaeria maculans (strain JN3 / isolate v23.1.3 / race Av1-4-5-6-7-8) TaxID=985895 RepID=E5AF56_LEPMJ|nr:predicted protein [Plenodomus lingam JN3]KAH9869236.1 hypothetical protein IAQ61_006441 [Plenodomus lingam]CBY01845.1 predicted protein [Plenodomus lingam JN3]
MSLKFLVLAIATVAYASPLDLPSKATNNDPCEPCQPQGATGTTPPTVGSALSSLYVDVLSSVRDINFKKRSVQARSEGGFCCRQSLDCLSVQNLNIAMCYDKFTTNYAFPDGSFGSLTTGEYNSGKATANLISGNYTNGNENGNIYANDPSARPNTATMSIPPQFTGTGVGDAIPATELGSIIVYTTTIPGTTYTAPTTLAETVRAATVSGVAVSTTVAATTISHATTIAPQTTLVTQTTVPESTTTSTAAAGQLTVGSTLSVGMPVFGALMYALYAL